MMKSLTRGQKAIIVLTGLWEWFVLIDSSSGRSRVQWEEFFILSLPFILYWSGVWIWGFGFVVNFLKKIKRLIFCKKLLIAGKVLMKIAILLFVLGFIGAILKSQEKPNKKTDNIYMSPEIKEIAYDYGVYYGLFIWQDSYCLKKGYKLKNLDILQKKYQLNIQNLENKLKDIKDSKGRSAYDIYILSGEMDKISQIEALEGFNVFRSMLISEKLSNINPAEAAGVIKNLSDPKTLSKYGHLVSEKEACQKFDEFLPEMIKDKSNPFSQMLNFFDKYI